MEPKSWGKNKFNALGFGGSSVELNSVELSSVGEFKMRVQDESVEIAETKLCMVLWAMLQSLHSIFRVIVKQRSVFKDFLRKSRYSSHTLVNSWVRKCSRKLRWKHLQLHPPIS